MYGKVLVAIAAAAALVGIAVPVLIRLGFLGSGDLAFIRFVWYCGGAAAVAVIAAIPSIILALLHRSSLTATVLTVLLCMLTVGVFLRVLIWGTGW